ncbi:hypothetical protein TPHA_0E00100 [Tetrapisispora phaffii CBS 4417]|uniref:RWD domain-containing protein n=1 Tax=Tetrapisispora phaffii (strain ATCC 24235 / CBS 4417 / NBRC 1672 / NRRL Y-8282 / UCD 70-5) TaxID=1071381 RepID=G8BT79_TETPH|nr:hypothetical protein TPHA_0E00100 [Tetrapisispora phaffii CBS 4417]CCE63107.1 hypothetical protein TPHA_0E00100 [Tetrapisispora phaffii CBS 4417]
MSESGTNLPKRKRYYRKNNNNIRHDTTNNDKIREPTPEVLSDQLNGNISRGEKIIHNKASEKLSRISINENNKQQKSTSSRTNSSKKTNYKRYTSDFNLSIIDDSAELKSSEDQNIRKEEIECCLRQLSHYSFKLFNKGKYVESFGFNHKLLDISGNKNQIRLLISIPNDYPKSPVKVNIANKKNPDYPKVQEEIFQLVKNFNMKSKDLLLKKYPIIAQINYLVQKKDILMNPSFKNIDDKEQQFYKDIYV